MCKEESKQEEQSVELPQLNNKENLCLFHFLTKHCSKYEAYTSAYNCKNMSRDTIYTEASRFFSSPKITPWLDFYRKNTQKTIQEELDYSAKDQFDELSELRGIALKSYDKNGNPNVNAAIKATELKGKLAGLYNQDREEVENKVVNVMGSISLGGKEVKFHVGDDIKDNS